MHALGLLPKSVHGGAFPGWLAPVQLVILPVSGAEEDAARALAGRCADLWVAGYAARGYDRA